MPLYLRTCVVVGAVEEIPTPCSATTVSEVAPMASPVCAVCEKVLAVKVIPVPEV